MRAYAPSANHAGRANDGACLAWNERCRRNENAKSEECIFHFANSSIQIKRLRSAQGTARWSSYFQFFTDRVSGYSGNATAQGFAAVGYDWNASLSTSLGYRLFIRLRAAVL
jgi:hypothetical protein